MSPQTSHISSSSHAWCDQFVSRTDSVCLWGSSQWLLVGRLYLFPNGSILHQMANISTRTRQSYWALTERMHLFKIFFIEQHTLISTYVRRMEMKIHLDGANLICSSAGVASHVSTYLWHSEWGSGIHHLSRDFYGSNGGWTFLIVIRQASVTWIKDSTISAFVAYVRSGKRMTPLHELRELLGKTLIETFRRMFSIHLKAHSIIRVPFGSFVTADDTPAVLWNPLWIAKGESFLSCAIISTSAS